MYVSETILTMIEQNSTLIDELDIAQEEVERIVSPAKKEKIYLKY